MNTKEIEVTLEQITDWKKENVVYIDTRGAIAYQHGHIAVSYTHLTLPTIRLV